ncbi:hypothetical protein [Pueribacillus theae]|nr:hypothetical protein [Pueribacillus theae]
MRLTSIAPKHASSVQLAADHRRIARRFVPWKRKTLFLRAMRMLT